MAKSDSKKSTLATLSSFLTVLEYYPSLLSGEYYGGEETSTATLSFMIDILKLLGLTEDKLITWLAETLGGKEEKGVEKGVIFAIEESVKAILLSYLNGMYDCPNDPVLPDKFLGDPHPSNTTPEILNLLDGGYKIPISEIDLFGYLQHCPVTDKGSVFYFDVKDMNASNVYQSTDMNAYLWYVINRGGAIAQRSIWDNRRYYKAMFDYEFENDGTRNKQGRFVDESCEGSPMRMINGIGPKKEIIYCRFEEFSTITQNDSPFRRAVYDNNSIVVYGNSDRYYKMGTTFTGDKVLNKTIFQFNADYISSLKLFDAKTLVAQIINAVIGISAINLSFEASLIEKKVEQLVEKILDSEDEDEQLEYDEYFKFDDDKYNELLHDATIRYSKENLIHTDYGVDLTYDTGQIIEGISDIDGAKTEGEQIDAVYNALMNVPKALIPDQGTGFWDFEFGYRKELYDYDFGFKYANMKRIIEQFIKELVIQIAMSVLSPKVMLIFAINARFLNEDSATDITTSERWEEFFKNFWNMIVACIRKISDLILKSLLDFIIGQLKPILDLIAKKLLLETIMYYRTLLLQLLESCTLSYINAFEYNGNPLAIDNVKYADIIPKKTTPDK